MTDVSASDWGVGMASIEKRSMDSTDDVRPFQAHGRADVVTIGDFTLGRGTFEPGWRWSSDVKPIGRD